MNVMLPATLPRTKCILPITYQANERRDLVAYFAAQVEAQRATL